MNRNGSIIVTALCLLFVGGLGVLIYAYWPAIKGTVTSEKYYTSEEAQALYDKGYSEGCNDKVELTGQVGYYKELNDQYYLNILEYQSQVNDLQSQNSTLSQTITNLTTIKNENEATIESLNSQILSNNSSISSLNAQISSLQNQVTNLTAQGTQNQSTIDDLNAQITSLTVLKNQLMATNTSNANTITVLNNQITTLNTRISELSLQISNNTGSVGALNNRISQLEDTIAYYESYIQTLQQQTQAIVTFEVDGSVYNIQIVNIGDYVSVTTPTNTTYMIFNGWKVNNTLINLATYQITQNTRIIADLTYKYDVTFVVDNVTYDTQLITLNNSPTTPTAPTKSGYDFDGWSLDGVNVVNLAQQTITANTTYYAVFTKVHTVTFMNGQNVVSTQSVRNGNSATNVTIANTTYVIFNGWLLNNVLVDLTTYVVSADTVFVADFIYKYDVTFVVDNVTYDTQIVTANGYATLPTAPTKNGYVFNGWTTDGTNVVNVLNTVINSNTTFIAKFTLDVNWTQKTWTGLTNFRGDQVWSDGTNYYYSSGTNQYVLNKSTSTWEQKTWTGLTNFYGSQVWKYYKGGGVYDFYYSDGEGHNYKLDYGTSNWRSVTFTKNGRTDAYIDGSYIWNYWDVPMQLCPDEDEAAYYFSTDMYGNGVWRVLDWFDDDYWCEIDSNDIWYDPVTDTYYCSNRQWAQKELYYDEDEDQLYWIDKTWTGLTNFGGSKVWSDGINVYYSSISGGSLNSVSVQYVLNRTTSTWEQKTWTGLTNIDARFIWSDGTNYYYSLDNVQYMLVG